MGVVWAGAESLGAVWDLLVRSGFLYPEKLAQLGPNVALVQHNLGAALRAKAIARSLLYEHGGQGESAIAGHVAALRIYRRTWLVHHLAAASGSPRAALMLSCAISEHLESRPDFTWGRAYYRPNNRWPARIFGGFCDALANRKQCRSDLFQYLVGPVCDVVPALARMEIGAATAVDRIFIAKRMAERHGGAHDAEALDADDLSATFQDLAEVAQAYAEAGLERRREVVVAKMGGRLIGWAMLEVSSPGINLSELTNACTVYSVFENDPSASAVREDVAVRGALLAHAQRRYHALGHLQCFALASGDPAPFVRRGFRVKREYVRWTVHRAAVKHFVSHISRLYLKPKRSSP